MTISDPDFPPLPQLEHPRKCRLCGREYTRNIRAGFHQATRGPATYTQECLICRAEHKAASERENTIKQHEKRTLKQEIRIEAKKKAKKLVTDRRAAVKARRKQATASAELAERELARKRLVHFTCRFNDKYDAGWVHKLTCAKLEKFSRDVAKKRSPRLMIFMPPRTGKSELASKNFPAWHLGHHPDHEIIASSYAVSLPMGFSRKIKDMLKDPQYHSVFHNTRLNPDAQATEGWLTTRGGGYVPAGVGGGITGKGAHILIIDDPVKDAQEADSETVREATWDWYGSTARTRLAPGGGVLVILTRWHDADLAGKLLIQMNEQLQYIAELEQEYKADLKTCPDEHRREELKAELAKLEEEKDEIERWEVVSFPAIATEDEWTDRHLNLISETQMVQDMGREAYDKYKEMHLDPQAHDLPEHRPGMYIDNRRLLRERNGALHPERFDYKALMRTKRNLQPRHWSALYQQNPVPDEGAFFRKDMFRYEPYVIPWRPLKVFSAWDFALGSKQQNDWTVGLTGALDYEGNLHIIDMVRFKGDTAEIVEAILDNFQKYQEAFQTLGMEQGQIQMAMKPAYEARKMERKLFPSEDETLKPITDKRARARPAQGWLQNGKIILPANQPWVETFVQELLRFDGGVHDDIVDAFAWLVRMVLNESPPTRPQPPKHKALLSTHERLEKYFRQQNRNGTGAMSA